MEKTVSPAYLEQLEQEAELGRSYLRGLRQDLVRLACLVDQDLDGGVFSGVAEKLTEPELLELKRVYQRRADGRFSAGAQLTKPPQSVQTDGEAFLI